MCSRSALFALRARTVERYTTVAKMPWDGILRDLEAAQKDTTRVGSKCYTTVADFDAYVEKTPRLKVLFSKTTSAPKKKITRACAYFNKHPDKYKLHLEKTKELAKTPKNKQYVSEARYRRIRRNATVARYTDMLKTQDMTLGDILKDLETVQDVVTKRNKTLYTTVEDFEKYIGNKIRYLNTYDKEDTSPIGKLAQMLIEK